jgi:DNA-binding NtrC family response regulator
MSERICIVVDDEPAIRTYLRAILKREHLQTLEAGTAAQALQIIQEMDGQLNLMIADITMPGDMNGLDLAHSVRNAFPSIPIILISGFLDTAGMKTCAFEFLQKPFVPEKILAAVRRAVNC